MRPDYAFKLYLDQRCRYIFLLVSLAMKPVSPVQ